MKFKTASALSTALHAAVLLWALVSFSGKTFEVTPAESLPVDLVTAEEFSKLAKGAKDAPKADIVKPLAEKKEEPKPAEDAKPKITEKKEIQAAKAEPPPPAAEPKPDPIGEKLKKEEPKPEAKAETKPLPPRKPPRDQPKFDPDKIATLLDKRDPQRHAAAGEVPNQQPSLGAASGSAARLSQSEIDALRARIRECWSPPVGAEDTSKLFVVFRVLFKQDGSIARDPVLIKGSASTFGPALAESAKRALLRCQPFTMLKPEHYDQWKDIEITFDLHEMLGG
jgi:outer membrane biosynthesis protein TonB